MGMETTVAIRRATRFNTDTTSWALVVSSAVKNGDRQAEVLELTGFRGNEKVQKN
jgi:hypothetical protein